MNTPALSDYLHLAKPTLVGLVLWTTAAGFWLGSAGGLDLRLLFHALVGTALVAAGSLAFNQWMEREEDAGMARTAGRPIPSGKIPARRALGFACMLTFVGLFYLSAAVNPVCTILAATTFASYLLGYTPLKRVTPLCVLVGAVPGALPPLIGWAAAAGELPARALSVFALMFVWQVPHFLTIGWRYREEYRSAGFQVMPSSAGCREDRPVARRMMVWTVLLVAASLLPSVAGVTGHLYFVSALALGAAYLACNAAGLRQFDRRARGLFLASLVYLALLFTLMAVDKA